MGAGANDGGGSPVTGSGPPARAAGIGATVGLLVAALSTLLSPAAGAAQTAPNSTPASASDPGTPGWLERWSPLHLVADLPRTLPAAEGAVPALLTRPPPRVGLFWTAGNPGGLADELADFRAEFRAGRSDASGEYRRPMDPGEERQAGVSGLAWGRLGDRGAGVGRVVFERADSGEPAFADVPLPYGSGPLAVLDTLGDPLNRTAVRVEGAGGWRAGPVGLGLGLAFESQDTRTEASPVPRTMRTASPGVTGGVSWAPEKGGVRVGAHGRWQRSAHTLAIFSVAAPSRVYALEGYNDPVPIGLNATLFQRRLVRETWAAGGGVGGGSVDGLAWAAFAQRERLTEERFDPRTADPLADGWEADAWTAGAAIRAPLLSRRLLVAADARYTTLDGEARRGDLEGITFLADEEHLELSGEARLEVGRAWRIGARAGLVHEARTRRDALAEARSEIEGWAPSAGLEAAALLGRLAVGLGGAVAFESPDSSIPDPTSLGPVYRRWIAPELAIETAEAWSRSLSATLRFRARETTAVWLRGTWGAVSATDPPPDVPDGRRRMWAIALGVLLERG